MSDASQFQLFLADAVLVIHFAFVAFVVAGFLMVWIGRIAGWNFVRNFWSRSAHLAAIGVVAAESLAGVVCPLTIWENDLRRASGGGAGYAGSFVQHWIHRLMFFEASEGVFTAAYVLFFTGVLASFWFVTPCWPWSKADKESS